ncbi:hypothetical protein [Leucobacter triazinivorans]|uniref:Cell division protein FtsL n=1 Tax=Leucobacter triazinivorans TaxID=1784719 RepID=A0A4P6KHX4_9MICO|nr:hypothetical protein [Leucobacter triazinivorans]QBE49920.1 hypothetical protein EVS81_14675 [Leucobacter triazinivorans]
MNNTVPIDVEHDALPGTGSPATHSPSREPGRPERSERHLRLAPPAPRRAVRPGRSPLLGALVAVGVVLAILATQLGLSIAVSQGAYETRALEIEQRDLARVERVLAQNVDRLASPQNLAENAATLGMVQNARPAALRLSDGAILGSLESPTSEVRGNLIPNSTLESMPVVDAEGLLVSRNQPSAVSDAPAEAPVRWTGKLPAPDTH